jgi:PAS domain-containing protein
VIYHAETSRDLFGRRFTSASGSSGPLLGISPEQSLADPMAWLSRVHPGDLPRLLAAEQGAARRLSTLDIEVRCSGSAGRIVLGRVESRPRATPEGQLLWDGMLLDVTAAREAEAELRRTSNLLQAIGSATPDLVYAKDRESRFLYANPAVASPIGQRAEELIGRSERD